MTSVTFHKALKVARRNIYTYPNAWRVAILASSVPQRKFAFDEARLVLLAGSLHVENINFTEQRIDVERGGQFWFRDVFQFGSLDWMKGHPWTHIMWLFDPALAPAVRDEARVMLRSPVVPQERLIEHECTL
jgi:hypothetical protein